MERGISPLLPPAKARAEDPDQEEDLARFAQNRTNGVAHRRLIVVMCGSVRSAWSVLVGRFAVCISDWGRIGILSAVKNLAVVRGVRPFTAAQGDRTWPLPRNWNTRDKPGETGV